MHIPDGVLSNRIWLSLDAVSGATVLYAARRLHIRASARLIPLMGVLSAFVFAAQLLNFPVLGGTSGHLVGGALLAILLGPLAGFLTMTTVVAAQALFLQDGGIAALGANIFNIAAIPALSGYGIYQLAGGRSGRDRGVALAGFLAGWASLVLSAVFCALQLALSGVVPLGVGLPAMAGYHAVIGIAEGGLTAAILAFLARTRPDLVQGDPDACLRPLDFLVAVPLVALPCAVLLLAGTSNLPDPLQTLLASTTAHPEQAPDSEQLLSPARYRDYLWVLASAFAVVPIAYALARASQRWKRNA